MSVPLRVAGRKIGFHSVAVIALIVLLVPLALFARSSGVVIPERSPFISFPLKLDGRVGKKQELPQVQQDVLKMTDYFLGSYGLAGSPPVSLFIGYFEAQSKGQAPHSPRVCIPGGGWEITSMETVKISLGDRQIPINRVLIAKGDIKQLVYYWFQQAGRSYASSYQAKFNIVWRGILSSRTDGALVRLVMPLGIGVPEKFADNQLTQFAGKMMKILPQYVPN